MSERPDDARSVALQAMVEGTERLLSDGSPVRRMAVGWRGSDEACDVVGGQIMAEMALQAGEPEDLDLYIATQVYAGGGHTAVIGDFVRASESARSEVIITGTVERAIHNGPIPAEIAGRLGVEACGLSVCPHEDRAQAVRWLMGEIYHRRPRRVFLFHHPQDAVAIAGTRADLCGELYLVHHADRQPTLGLHQCGTRIIDLSPFAGEFTRRVLGLESAYVPLVIGDPGLPPERKIDPPIATASSGAAHKFGDDYAENVARILQVTGGRHLHIGFLKAKRLEKIRTDLGARGIDTARFEYIEWVPSLARALIEREIDVLVGSSPMGGARTSIEATAAGVPVLSYLPGFSTHFAVSHVKPGSWPVWRTVEELVDLLEKMDARWIAEQRRVGREFYDKHHHPEQLRQALGDLAGTRLPPRDDLPLSELVDVAEIDAKLVGEWSFLRCEFGGLAL